MKSSHRHASVGWIQVPHPRYGESQPYFTSFEVETPCDCTEGKRRVPRTVRRQMIRITNKWHSKITMN